MMRFIARVLCRIFFRNVYISGTPYTGKSAIWAANHTSAIVDPVVVFGTAPVRLRPLSKHTLWKDPFMKVILGWTKAIPLYRAQDATPPETKDEGAEQPLKSSPAGNDMTFMAVTQNLISGSRILIFPEGISHDEPRIYKLKTGVARMALQALATSTEKDFTVVIQPVAIDYFEKDEFRSDVSVHFCEPTVVTSADMDVRDIMQGLADALNDGYASFFSWDEKRNWLFIFELTYGRGPQSGREFRVFVESMQDKFASDEVLMARIQTMRRMLMSMGVTPSQLVWGESREQKRSFFKLILTHVWFYVFVTVPLEYIAGLFWYYPYRLCGKLAEKSTKERDLVATMKLAHGMWIFPLWAVLGATLLTGFFLYFNPALNFIYAWTGNLLLGPAVLILSILAQERRDFFPGYWRLARLRLMAPRGWREVMTEWREIAESCLSKVNSEGPVEGVRKKTAVRSNESPI